MITAGIADKIIEITEIVLITGEDSNKVVHMEMFLLNIKDKGKEVATIRGQEEIITKGVTIPTDKGITTGVATTIIIVEEEDKGVAINVIIQATHRITIVMVETITPEDKFLQL